MYRQNLNANRRESKILLVLSEFVNFIKNISLCTKFYGNEILDF
jgi:hypothetical protein